MARIPDSLGRARHALQTALTALQAADQRYLLGEHDAMLRLGRAARDKALAAAGDIERILLAVERLQGVHDDDDGTTPFLPHPFDDDGEAA